jgi:hypothetical protein
LKSIGRRKAGGSGRQAEGRRTGIVQQIAVQTFQQFEIHALFDYPVKQRVGYKAQYNLQQR